MVISMPRDRETFEQAVARLSAEVIEAFNRGDVHTCAAYYAEDAALFLPDRPTTKGRAAIEGLLGDYVAKGAKLASIEPVEMRSSGDLGYCVGGYRFDIAAGQAPAEAETGRFATVFRRQPDGSWKAVIDSLIGQAAANG